MQEAVMLAETVPYVPVARNVITTLYPDIRPPRIYICVLGVLDKVLSSNASIPVPRIEAKT